MSSGDLTSNHEKRANDGNAPFVPQQPPNPFVDLNLRAEPEVLDAEVIEPHDWLKRVFTNAESPPTFHVPTRFGMSAILGITTALALLFGMLRFSSAHEMYYLFFGLLAMIICLVQMRWGGIARQVSIAAGAILLPLFVIAMAVFAERNRFQPEILCFLLFSIPAGGFLGYLTGTCAGGVFLLMDLFEKYWTRRAEESRLDGPFKQS